MFVGGTTNLGEARDRGKNTIRREGGVATLNGTANLYHDFRTSARC